MGIFTCNRYCLSLSLKKSSKQFLFFRYHKSIHVFWLQQRGSRAIQNFQNRVTRFYAPVARNSQVYVCMRMRLCDTLHEPACITADSRVLAQRIPLDGTSTQILPFERTQISDKSCTNRHSRNGLLEVHQGTRHVQAFLFAILLETLVLLSRRNGPMVTRRK